LDQLLFRRTRFKHFRLRWRRVSIFAMANKKRKCYALLVNDIRRGALLITAAILAARRIALCQSKPSPALEYAISDSIIMAEKILKRIDERWPPDPSPAHASSPARRPTN
jgi:hypothetical protein